MVLTLHTLKSKDGKKRKKRIGRGNAGKGGTYAGRGMKGQRSRSGGRRKAKHAGKRGPAFVFQLPKKRGFTSLRRPGATVNLNDLEREYADGSSITLKELKSKGLVPRSATKVKVLGTGTMTKKLTVVADRYTKTAEQAIKKAGGNADKPEQRDAK